MKILHLLMLALLFSAITALDMPAQDVPLVSNCRDNQRDPLDPPPSIGACNQVLLNGLTSGEFGSSQYPATPFLDTVPNGQGHWPDYGDPDNNIVSLYGVYGNNERTSSSDAPRAHYQEGVTLANQITPLCKNPNGCPDTDKSIVFLFIGFSNTDIEIGGGNSDVWDGIDLNNNASYYHFNQHLYGQACSTHTENLNNPDNVDPWNQVKKPAIDGYTQQSLLYQVYSPQVPLVGSHVVVWNGALGQQTLNKWDPTTIGYYAINQNCTLTHGDQANPECNWVRVNEDLQRNGFSEYQVQAVFIKDGDAHPHCDLKGAFWDSSCTQNPPVHPELLSPIDAYQAEQYLGDIMRYLKCCKLNPDGTSSDVPRYPNLKQVFVTSRIYGGWANGNANGCLNPEPFAYELAFAVQRAIVQQINQTNGITLPPADPYSGPLNYTVAPWFDWAPYLWAARENISPGSGLNWCDYSIKSDTNCMPRTGTPGDVRFGDQDPNYAIYVGDQIHPTGWGTKKVADQLRLWLQGSLPAAQTYLSDWITPWIQK